MQALEGSHAELYFPRYGHFQWLRSLSKIAKSIKPADIRTLYISQNVARRASSSPAAKEIDTKTYANLFLSLQYYVALIEMLESNVSMETMARIAVMDWYYGLYWAVNAMLMAQGGSHPEAHRPAATEFCRVFSERSLLPEPFNLHVSSLVRKTYEQEILAYAVSEKPSYSGYAFSKEQAMANLVGSLNGNAKWYKERTEDEIKATGRFKDLGVSNFKTKKAQELRDKVLAKHNCGFLHQAFRARGKANYRDATYLGYGEREREWCGQFIEDLEVTLGKFLLCAATFCQRKVQKNTWESFIEDIKDNSWFADDSIEPLTDAI